MTMVDDFNADPMMGAAPEVMPDEPRDEIGELHDWLASAPFEQNLVPLLNPADIAGLAETVVREWKIDEESRSAWWSVVERALNLVDKEDAKDSEKDWGADVRYPLIMTAALRFNAQAYPAIVAAGDIVKCAVKGADRDGAKAARALRVSTHMSSQLRSDIDGWEEDTDRLLMQLPLVGVMHRKVWHDYSTGETRARLLPAGRLILNDAAKSLRQAPRLSEVIPLYPDEIESRVRGGVFADGAWREEATDEGGGDSYAPVDLIEQHRREDLDGDGYPEPYVVTVHEKSGTVVRIVANWTDEGVKLNSETGQVAQITPRDHFVDYHFMPDPRGRYHSMGLGLLLGDLSEAINGTINMIADSAHMDMAGSGWIGAEARLPGGRKPFRPGEFRQIASRGTELRSAIVQRQTSGPSQVLFNLLGLMNDAARELANVQDIDAQAGRSNQPATTTLALIEQGQMVTRAIFQRVFRAFGKEFRLVAGINAETLTPEEYQAFHDEEADPRADYDMRDMDIEPLADAAAVTTGQKVTKARVAYELAQAGIVDPRVATRRVLEAAGIPGIEELMPEPEENPEQAMMQGLMMQAEMMRVQLELRKLEAEIVAKEADAVKTMAEAETVDEMRPVEVALAQVKALQERLNAIAGDNGRPGRVANPSGDAARAGPPQGGFGGAEGGSLGGAVELPGGLGAGVAGMGGNVPPAGGF